MKKGDEKKSNLVSENGLFLAVVGCLFNLIAFSSAEKRAQCFASGLMT